MKMKFFSISGRREDVLHTLRINIPFLATLVSLELTITQDPSPLQEKTMNFLSLLM
jgi:hypothetical protein